MRSLAVVAVLVRASITFAAPADDQAPTSDAAPTSDEDLSDEEAEQEAAIDALEPPELQRHGEAAAQLRQRLKHRRRQVAPAHRFALATNPPLRWVGLAAIAASGYVAVSPRSAVRANVAVYDYDANLAVAVISQFVEDPARRTYDGRIVDVGVGWTYFPRTLCDGATFEVGVLRRAAKTHLEDAQIVDRNVRTYATRALVGWSWLIRDRVFIAIALGGSEGYTYGRESTARESPQMDPKTRQVAAWDAALEGYFRVGFAFGSRP
jgi:hypothetical protein